MLLVDAKPVKLSRTLLTDLIFPPSTNHLNTVFGGKVMAYVDKIACKAAMHHCRKPVVTDSFDFLAPIKTGEAINLEAYVTWTHRTSMEICVKVESENLLTGEKRLTSRAYQTIITLDEEGKLLSLRLPETEEEIRQHSQAKERYELWNKRIRER